MPEPNDRELLKDIAAGNAPALRALYGRISSRVYNTALSYVQNEADAEEITQDVFTKIWRSAESFKAESQVTTWVYRITVNTSLTAIKKRERRGLFSTRSTRSKKLYWLNTSTPLPSKERIAVWWFRDATLNWKKIKSAALTTTFSK